MGMITVTISGSFRGEKGSASFGALQHGHAQAVADAIRFLSEKVLPDAINQDHELQAEGCTPEKTFGKKYGVDKEQ